MFIREATLTYSGPKRRAPDAFTQPAVVAAYLAKRIGAETVEVFFAVALDARHRPLADYVVSRGTINASLVHPREVFRPAIALGAASIIVAHNHPSGDPSPSAEDTKVTKRLREAGEILGIKLLDHIVIGDATNFYSFNEHGA